MVNLNRLSELLGNDKHIINRFLDLYCEKVPELMIKLKEQLLDMKYADASITAHEIKSQSAYLGLDTIVEYARTIEDLSEKKTQLIQQELVYEKLAKDVNNALVELRDLK